MFWKNYAKNNEVFSIALWIHIYMRIFGMWPFSVQFDQRKRTSHVHVTKLDLLWIVVVVAAYLTFLYVSIIINSTPTPLSISIVRLAKITQICGFAIAILSIFLDLINRKRIWQLVLNFNHFDQEVFQFFFK